MTFIEIALIVLATASIISWMALVICALAHFSECLERIVALLEERRPPPPYDVTSSPPWTGPKANTATTGFTHHIPRSK